MGSGRLVCLWVIALASLGLGCSGDNGGASKPSGTKTGGTTSKQGGAIGSGGGPGGGGVLGAGGSSGAGGNSTSGGAIGSGGSPGGGGVLGAGGSSGRGGNSTSGGAIGSGGNPGGGGVLGTGGSSGRGGNSTTGGATGLGGIGGTAGATVTGGTSGSGGVFGTAGVTATGGATGGRSGSGGGPGTGGRGTVDAGQAGGAGTGGIGNSDAGAADAGMNSPSCTGSGQTYYASPSGTGTDCTLDSPCPLDTAAANPKPGDIVCLRGGSYTSALSVPTTVSGTDTSWVTFAAYPGELPIINGGVKISGKSTHIRFNGIATLGGESGFANPLNPSAANGPLEFINCIADMNTMNGVGFHGTGGLRVSQCIVAHTGSSTTNSWSSGVDLWSSKGTYQDTIIERTVAFENADMQKHTDGSGFCVDTNTTGATFVNNIGFRNGGSCFRVTNSTSTHMINNTCYANGLDPQATAPTNPGEFYASSQDSTAVIYNNIAVATGRGGDSQAMVNFNGSKQSNNVTNSNGSIDFWVDAAGTNPDFHLKSSATTIIGKGTTSEAPSEDIGFDPKCIVKKAPTGTGVQSWWLYSIDYDYIKSIGGTAQCFHPKARSGTPDIGAYAH